LQINKTINLFYWWAIHSPAPHANNGVKEYILYALDDLIKSAKLQAL